MADEQLRMQAVVVDGFTSPMRRLRNELQNVGRVPAARVMSEDWRGLGVRVGSVTSALRTGLAPALYGVGTASLGVTTSVAAIALAIPKAVNAARDLHITSRELGVSFQKLRELGGLGKLFSMDEAQVKGDLQTFQDNLDQIRKGWGEAYGKLRAMNLGDLVGGLKNAPDLGSAVDQALDAIAKLPNPVRQREVAKALLGSEQWATVAREATPELRRKIRESLSDIPVVSKEMADKFIIETFRMGAAWEALTTRLGVTMLPSINKFLEQLPGAMKEATREIDEIIDEFKNKGQIKLPDLKIEIDKDSTLFKIYEWLTVKKPGLLDNVPSVVPGMDQRVNEQQTRIGEKRKQLAGLDESMFQLDKESQAYKRLAERREELVRSIRALEEGLRKLQQQIDDATDPLKKMNFTAPGGGSILVPASLGGGGLSGGSGGFRSGGLRGGSFGLGGGGASSIPPMGTPGGGGFGLGGGGRVRGGSDGPGGNEGIGSVPPMGEGAAGGAGLAADRARFSKELQDKPGLREKIMGIAAGENKNPTANLAVIESMMNRASMRGTSLEQAAKLYGKEAGGYYAGYDPGSLSRPKIRGMIEANMGKALGGSNVSNYATDNASSWLAAKHKRTGGFTSQSDYGGESFFSPGTSGRGVAGRGRYNEWLGRVSRGGNYSGVTADEMQRRASGDDMMGRAFGQGGVVGGGAVKVDGGADVNINFNGLPAGAKTSASTRGMFRNVVLNRGRQMGMAEDTPLASD